MKKRKHRDGQCELKCEQNRSHISVIVFETINGMTYGWGSLVIGHLLVIFASYYTFHSFKNIRLNHKQSAKGNLRSWDECIDFLKKKDGN